MLLLFSRIRCISLSEEVRYVGIFHTWRNFLPLLPLPSLLKIKCADSNFEMRSIPPIPEHT